MRPRVLASLAVVLAALFALVAAPAASAATGVVRGTLVDPDGVPVEGGSICPTGPMAFPCSVVTGPDGSFSLAVEEGTTTLRATPSGFTGSPFVPTTFGVTVTPDGVDVGNVVVNRYGSITGIVRDPNGTAVPFAMVNACSSCTPVSTDASGRYTLRNVVPGDVTVTAFVQGNPTPAWYPGTATVAVGSGQVVTQDLALVRGAVVSGTITGPDGAPVSAGVPVTWRVTSSNPPMAQGSTVYTDAFGRYTTPGLPGGAVVIGAGPNATGSSVASPSLTIALGDVRTVDLQLGNGGWVLGTVTGLGGAPVAGAFISMPGVPSVMTAADGTYRLRAVNAGTYTVSVSPPYSTTYAPATRSVVVIAGQGSTANVALDQAGSIAGTLTGPTGPVGGRVVTACVVPAMSPCAAAMTAPSGAFTIGRLAAGNYSLAASPAPNAQPPFAGASVSPVVVVSGATTTQDLVLGIASTPGNANGTVLAGSTIATVGPATATNPVVTSVRSPIQTSITISEGVPATIANATILGQAVELHSGAPASSDAPFTVTFTVDSSAFGSVDPLTADLRRNGEVVAACADPAASTATPDPCVASRTLNGEGDLVVVARTSAFSVWAVTAPSIEPYPLSDFFSPIRTGPEVNAAKAGRTVPVKFSLGGDRGLDVLAEGSPSSRAVPCSSAASVAVPDLTSEPSALHYDATSDQYAYLWRTSSTWTGCRELSVRFVTGQELTAVFRFS
jgi:hypothetical protein